MEFDSIWAWEVKGQDPATYWSSVPDAYMSRFARHLCEFDRQQGVVTLIALDPGLSSSRAGKGMTLCCL